MSDWYLHTTRVATPHGPIACDFVICGTGMGMSIIANKYSGVIASCVESVESARLCRGIWVFISFESASNHRSTRV